MEPSWNQGRTTFHDEPLWTMAETLTKIQFYGESAMRSMILALALVAPLSAVAATHTFTSPMSNVHQPKPQEVYLTFINHTNSDREVRIGNEQYKMRLNSEMHVYAPVGSTVRLFSETNSKVNGQELMTIQASDSNRDINLN
jgi:hypothetical protein